MIRVADLKLLATVVPVALGMAWTCNQASAAPAVVVDDFSNTAQSVAVRDYFPGSTTGSGSSAPVAFASPQLPAFSIRVVSVFFQGYGGAGQPAPHGSALVDPVVGVAELSVGGGNCCYTGWNLSAAGVEYSVAPGGAVNLLGLGAAFSVAWVSQSEQNLTLGWRVTVVDSLGNSSSAQRSASGGGTQDLPFSSLTAITSTAASLTQVVSLKYEAVTLTAGWGAGFAATWDSVGLSGTPTVIPGTTALPICLFGIVLRVRSRLR
jgi:hypothetical protein